MEQLVKRRKKFKFPSTVTLLSLIILLVAILTFIIPSGSYERKTDEALEKTLVVPGSYTVTEKTPITYVQLFASFYNSVIEAGSLIAFVFVCGGAFGIINKTGAISAGLMKMIGKFRSKEGWFIALVMVVFAVGGATYGMAEETIPFVALLVAVAIQMGFDPIVGVSMVLVGVYAGYTSGVMNPFSTGIAQGICELPLFSGIGLRIIFGVGALAIAIYHVVIYSKKYKKKLAAGEIQRDFEDYVPDKSLIGDQRPLVKLDYVILSILLLTIVVLVFGVLKYQWFFEEMAALFMTMAIVIGMIYYKGDFDATMNAFIDGAKSMAGTVLVVALSRGVLIMMQNGGIIDTIIYWLSWPLAHMHPIFASWGMYLMQGLVNFVIPSSSGMATAVMPIMSSVADLTDLSRQTAVLAYQCGDGFWNLITPAHATTMACIGIAGISFKKWFKFVCPLVVKWTVWVMIILAAAVITGYGPF